MRTKIWRTVTLGTVVAALVWGLAGCSDDSPGPDNDARAALQRSIRRLSCSQGYYTPLGYVVFGNGAYFFNLRKLSRRR